MGVFLGRKRELGTGGEVDGCWGNRRREERRFENEERGSVAAYSEEVEKRLKGDISCVGRQWGIFV